jgi:hypothetical protein
MDADQNSSKTEADGGNEAILNKIGDFVRIDGHEI